MAGKVGGAKGQAGHTFPQYVHLSRNAPLSVLSIRFADAEDDAYKKYNRNLRATKADLVAYERQKEAALGLTPGTLVPAGATSSPLTASSSKTGLSGAEDLYRGADTLAYGDNKPSEDAVDRVISKINKEYVILSLILFHKWS